MSRVVEIDLTDTLMRLDDYLGVHLQTNERHSTYYFRVPDGWAGLTAGELEARVKEVMTKIYREFNRGFKLAEPDDPNYLAPLAVECRVLTAEEEGTKPWVAVGSPALWEWTPCVVVGEDGGYEKVEVGEF
jgi:hypothetical protein